MSEDRAQMRRMLLHLARIVRERRHVNHEDAFAVQAARANLIEAVDGVMANPLMVRLKFTQAGRFACEALGVPYE